MRWPQFSLMTLAGVVAFVAIACAALVYASALWSSILFTSVIVWLILAMLAAIYRQGSARAFLVGSAICGWTYLLLVFWPVFGPSAIWTLVQDGHGIRACHLPCVTLGV